MEGRVSWGGFPQLQTKRPVLYDGPAAGDEPAGRMMTPTIWDHGLAVLCGLVLPLLGVWQQRQLAADDEGLEPFETREKIAMYWGNSAMLLFLAGLVVLVWWLVGRSLDTLGLTAAPRQWLVGGILAGVLLVAYVLDTGWSLVTSKRRAEARRRWRRDTPFMPETWREARHSLVLITSAAVGEEIVFRGFLVSYVASLTGSSTGGLTLAVALPSLVFALCHAYQGAHAMVKIAVGAALFGAIFVVTGSLWIPIVLHFLVDLVASLLGPVLMGPPRESVIQAVCSAAPENSES